MWLVRVRGRTWQKATKLHQQMTGKKINKKTAQFFWVSDTVVASARNGLKRHPLIPNTVHSDSQDRTHYWMGIMIFGQTPILCWPTWTMLTCIGHCPQSSFSWVHERRPSTCLSGTLTLVYYQKNCLEHCKQTEQPFQLYVSLAVDKRHKTRSPHWPVNTTASTGELRLFKLLATSCSVCQNGHAYLMQSALG